MKHFNKLTPAELERLAILAEECGEVIRVVGKVIRHGYESYNPIDPTVSNREQLTNELGDLANIVGMMVDTNDLNSELLEFYQDKKAETIHKWLHHQGEQK